MRRMKKYDKYYFVTNSLIEDSTMDSLAKTGYLKCIGHVPHLGERSWLFKYNDIFIVLHDLGNGHYSFLCPGYYVDILFGYLYNKLVYIEFCLRKLRKKA